MPLHPGKSREVFSRNVSEMIRAGHPQAQALAASYCEQRQSRAPGGPVFPPAMGAGAFPGPQGGLGALGQRTSPQASPMPTMVSPVGMPSRPPLALPGARGGLGALSARPPGFQEGGAPDDISPLHQEYLARRGIETASPDLSPTATAADLRGEALGMADPLGIPSYAAGRISPSLGEKLEAIKRASPEGYGAGTIISPLNDIPGAAVSKGIGLTGQAYRAAPATTSAIAGLGALGAGTAAAGDQPAGRPAFSKEDTDRLKELDDQIKQSDIDRAKYIKSKEYAGAPGSARNATLKTFADKADAARAEAQSMRSRLAADQEAYDKAGEPTAIAHPGAVLAARAGGLGLSGLIGAVGGWKNLPFTKAVAGGAGMGALGAAAPTAYDLMAPEGTAARKQAEAAFADPDFYKRVGIDAGLGALEGGVFHEAGHTLGARSRRPAAESAAPAAAPPSPAPSAPAPQAATPARGGKRWPDNPDDIDMFKNSLGQWQEHGTGHFIPKHLRPDFAPAEAQGGPVGYAFGGNPISSTPYFARAEARSLGHTGPVIGSSLGRGDSKSITVPGGSYVLPASHVSGLGQGNTLAGHSILNSMFSGGPYGSSMPRGGRGMGPPKPPRAGGFTEGGQVLQHRMFGGPGQLEDYRFADGGAPQSEGVPIMISDGEHVLSPEQVAQIGGGDIERGHRILDAWVKHEREKHVKELKKLPGPAKS